MAMIDVKELKKVISPLAQKHGFDKVILFGSYARGDYNEESDIDLLVYPGRTRGYFAIGKFYTDVEDATGKKVDVLTRGALDDAFYESIKKDEVILYEI